MPTDCKYSGVLNFMPHSYTQVLGGTDLFQSLHIDLGGAPFHLVESRAPAVAVNFLVTEDRAA